MDALEMPMLFALLGQIQELPPADFLAIAQVKEAQKKAEQEKRSALSSFEKTKGKVRRRGNGD